MDMNPVPYQPINFLSESLKVSPLFPPASAYLVQDNPNQDFCNSEGYLENQMQVLSILISAKMAHRIFYPVTDFFDYFFFLI